MFSTGAIATFAFIWPPTDDDDAGDGGSYKSGTTTDFWVGSSEAFSKLATGADDAPELSGSGAGAAPLVAAAAPVAPELAVAPLVEPTGVAWAAKSLSLSRATVDEFVGQVDRSLIVRPLRLMASLSSFS